MKRIGCALLLAAAASFASPSLADEELRRERLEVAPPLPVYCQNDADQYVRIKGVDLRAFCAAFAQKLGWASLIERVTEKDNSQYMVVSFAELDRAGNATRIMRFFLDPQKDGLGLRFADFDEPDRPLMHADGDQLCDYVGAVVEAEAPPKR
jgi:hypothetical protein